MAYSVDWSVFLSRRDCSRLWYCVGQESNSIVRGSGWGFVLFGVDCGGVVFVVRSIVCNC